MFTVLGSYVADAVKHSTAAVKNYTQVPDAVEVYRKALAASPDRSVAIASIGFSWNLEALLKSQPDSISALNGTQLVAQKVSIRTIPPAIRL